MQNTKNAPTLHICSGIGFSFIYGSAKSNGSFFINYLRRIKSFKNINRRTEIIFSNAIRAAEVPILNIATPFSEARNKPLYLC